ncbi:MAG: histidine--tRNA ligase [Candidatus Nealsonbacteria bacterium]|nr:histidine--tRNA ligase [Candidatus Nealsonbacteria bacterium]
MNKRIKILKGFQDFLPKKMILKNYFISKIRDVYERFGFLPQDTPCLEYADLLLGKYGKDGERLIYEFKDKGNRQVAMRYDLTVPLERVVRMYEKDIGFPYRRYQIGKVWRADKPGRGRFREFLQVDADIIGDDSILSDAETIVLVINTMDSLGLKTMLRINSREILDVLVNVCGVEERGVELMRVIDKFEKVGMKGVVKELEELNFSSEVVEKVKDYLSIKGSNEKILSSLKEFLKEGEGFDKALDRLIKTVELINKAGDYERNFKIDPTIARGLDYYTGLIFETSLLKDPSVGSICSGGRYDRLVKLSSGDFSPAVGVSIGLDRLLFVLEETDSLPEIGKTTTQFLIVNFGKKYEADYLNLANELRARGFSVEIFYQDETLSEQLSIAESKEIPFVLITGPEEMKNNMVTVRNMKERSQEKVPRSQIISKLKEVIKT